MRKYLITGLFSLCAVFLANGQDNSYDYQLPPKLIADMVLAKPVPQVTVDEKGEWMALMEYNSYAPVEELAKPELKIAGLRINPANFSPSRQNFIVNIYLKNIPGGKEFKITGLPSPLSATAVTWSPGERKLAFLNTAKDRVDLYVVDLSNQKASRVNKTPLNLVTGGTYQWVDDQTILYRTIIKPASAAPAKSSIPRGPVIQENYGKASPRPTFQDLIKSPHDERLYEFYATSQLVKNNNGTETKIGQPAIYFNYSISPDNKYMLVRTLKKPFSYVVPAGGFPSMVVITDMNGKVIRQLADLPSTETSPSGNDNVQYVPRGFDWRDDVPATVYWAMPLDSGFIKKNVDFHDAIYAIKAPFNGQPDILFKTRMRYRFVTWGNATTALVTEGLTGKQQVQVNRFNPSNGQMEKLYERNTTDAYANPGNPVTVKNEFGRNVLKIVDGNKLLMNNQTGSSPAGDLPFLAHFDLETKSSGIIWRSPEGFFEYVVRVLDADNLEILTRKESVKEVPNFWIKNLQRKIADRQLTQFKNPYPQLEGVTKQKIFYKRADGVDLTGDLYLPKGYQSARDGKLPVIIWAYPAEFNSAADAAQVRGSEHKFPLLNWGSPVYYVTQGYAVLNNAEMPIVATGKDKKPNDDFIRQLTLNAEAAIRVLDSLGVGDRDRVAVGGHSYGAFMTANLLAHTKLFKAGIARSGAYNRSLTPFGFQNEDRTYWQALQLYTEMSPFSYAHRIKTPLLLVHGEMDNNTGTFPIQSERMFNAIKGHGGTVKFISLPYESHGYAGRENILHLLNEQLQWLEKYVKNAGKMKAF